MNIHGAVMLLLFAYIRTDRLTDMVMLRYATMTLLRINRPPASDADDCFILWCTTVEILPVIYRDKTRRQTARRHLLDSFDPTFLLCARNAQYYVYYSVLFAIERKASVEINLTNV